MQSMARRKAELVERPAGGDDVRMHLVGPGRSGEPTCYPFPTLSIGAVVVDATTSATHMEV